MGLIAFITKMAVISVTVIADAMAITAIIATMAVVPFTTMMAIMSTMHYGPNQRVRCGY